MGLVSSISPSGLVLNLGRIEATLPRKEQLPGERYEAQQRVRAYVTEVKRSGRGPQVTFVHAQEHAAPLARD